MPVLDTDDVVKAKVRLEGCLNQFFTLTLKDKSEHKFYAHEESIRDQATDQVVWMVDAKLNTFLMGLEQMEPLGLRDPEEDAVEFEVNFEYKLIHDAKVFKNGIEQSYPALQWEI